MAVVGKERNMLKQARKLLYNISVMRKIKHIGLFLTVFVSVLALSWGISHAGSTGVVNSKHDLSWDSSATGDYLSNFLFVTGETCIFCHTPHGGNTATSSTYWNSSGYQPGSGGGSIALWNRNFTPASNGFQLYSSSTMEAQPDKVGAYSLMCLSCHDGVSSINVLRKQPKDLSTLDGTFDDLDGLVDNLSGAFGADAFWELGSVPQNIGDAAGSGDTVDLRNDHPISIDYTAAQSTDNGLKPATASGNGYYVTDARVKLYTYIDGNNVSVECPTCHDPHNQGVPNDNTTNWPFLVMSNDGSALCFACHDK